ncbi:hypothetical protein VIGAN_05162500, partial [Vigna angularis var. angularis]
CFVHSLICCFTKGSLVPYSGANQCEEVCVFFCCNWEVRLSSWREVVQRPYNQCVFCACCLVVLTRCMVGAISFAHLKKVKLSSYVYL